MEDKSYIFENNLNIARGYVGEKEYSKALKFFKKAYKSNLGKNDIELIIDIALIYDILNLDKY